MIDSDYIESPGIHRRIIGITKKAKGTHLMLECKHDVPVSDSEISGYQFGDPRFCRQCTARAAAELLGRSLK